MQQQVSIYSCTLSTFGAAFIESVLVHAQVRLDELVLASPKLWWNFHCRLQGLPQQAVPIKVQRRYARQKTVLVKRLAAQYPNAALREVDTAHTEAELVRLRRQTFVLCAGFPELFRQEVLDAPIQGIVNFHPSFLPRCRGAHPLYWTIAKREPFGGISSHFMTADIDAGPIIHRERIDFNSEEITYAELFSLIKKHLPQAITATMEQLAAGQTVPVSQISEVPSYHRNDRDEDHLVVWENEEFATTSAKIRAGNAFMLLSTSERLGLAPPVRGYDKNDADGYFQTRDGIRSSCKLVPFQFRMWERVLLRLLRSVPRRRQAFLQRIGQRKLKAYYLRPNKSS